MKLNEYIKELQEMADKHGDLEVIYSSDDEGNRYDTVWGNRGIGQFDSDEKQFIGEDEAEWYRKEYEKDFVINSICIN